MIFIIIPYFYGFIQLRISFIVTRVLNISLGSLEIRCALLYSIVTSIFYFVSHFTIFLPLLSLYFCISDWPEAFLKWLRSTSQMFASFFIFFPLFNLFFPFSIYNHIFLRITQIRFDYVLNWLISLEKRKKLSKNCSTQEFNSINKTENGKIASRKREAGAGAGALPGSVYGNGFGSSWVVVRRLMTLTLWSSFFFIIRLNYRKFEMIFKRENWQLPGPFSARNFLETFEYNSQ